MQILKASEDYLETMLMLRNSLGYVRSVDVAEHLGVTKPSVTYATKRLRENAPAPPHPHELLGGAWRGSGDSRGGRLQNGA